MSDDETTTPRSVFLNGKIPGVNTDRIDVDAGIRMLHSIGWDDNANRTVVIQLALNRWRRGEEEAAEKLAIDRQLGEEAPHGHGIDLTSWRMVLAAAMAGGEARARD